MTQPQPKKPTAETMAGATAAHEAVTALLTPFRQEAEATRRAIEDRSRAQRRINAWLMGFVAVTCVLAALVIVILLQNRQSSAKSRQLISDTAHLSEQIADCTTVGGACYQRGQQRLTGAYDHLTLVGIYTKICLRDQPDATAQQLKSCVDRGLAAARIPPK